MNSCCNTDSERPYRLCHLANNFDSRRIFRILHNGPGDALQNYPFPWLIGSGPLLIHGILSLPKSTPKTASRSVHPFVQGSRLCSTDTHTCRPRYICNNRPHLCTPCVRCGLIVTVITIGCSRESYKGDRVSGIHPPKISKAKHFCLKYYKCPQ